MQTVTSFSNRNSQIFQFIDSSTEIPIPRFVLLPHYKDSNETFTVEYKSFSKSSTLVFSPDWILSIHVDRHYFYNNQSTDIIHAMCFLQFNIEKNNKDVGRNASCKITFRSKNLTTTANCTIKIGRPPGICSSFFDFSDINLPTSPPTWASISAELSFSPSEYLTSSINSQAVLFNGIRPVNWTTVQKIDNFRNFAIGLPLESVKSGSSFQMPLSITELDDLEFVKILMEYDQCLLLNNIEINRNRWETKTNFEHDKNRESGVIQIWSRNRNRVEENFSSRLVVIFF